MKKILLLLLVMTAFSWQINAQYCAAGPTSTADSNVEAVSITGDAATAIAYTGCPANLGVNVTGLSVDVTGASTYTLDITFGTCGGNYGGAGEAWIDYNQNDVFDASESVGSSSGTPGSAPWDVAVSFSVTIPMTAYNGTTTMRVMQEESGSNPLDPCGTYSWGSVDEFTINISGATDPPACTLPSGMVASNETASGADLAWTENGTATVWDLEIGVSGFAATGTPTDNDITPNTGYTWSAGTSGTTYDVYYRSDCAMDDTDVSGWNGPVSFTTAPDYCAGDTFYDNGGTGNYSATTLDETTVCPDNAGDVVTVTFSSFATEANWDGLMIHNGNSISAPIFDSGAPVGSSTTNCPAGAYHGTNNPGTLTSTDASGCITFAFRADTGVDAGWEATFTCLPPPSCATPSSMVVSNETLTGADFAWTENGTATAWDLEIGVTGFTPTETPTDEDVTPNTGYTWTGGANSTTYDLYYRADCDGGNTNTSLWVGPITFTTLTPPPAEDVCGGAIPITVGSGTCGAMAVANNAGATDSDNDVPAPPAASCGSYGGGDIWFSLVVPASGNVVISGAASADCCSFLWYEVYNGADCSSMTSIACSVPNGNDPSQYETTLNGETPGQTIWIRAYDSTNNDGPGDFNMCAYEPPCAVPTTLVATNETPTGATLGWTEAGSATTWDLYIVATGDPAPTAASTPTDAGITTNPHVWTSGAAVTTYDWYVRADCGGALGTSDWSIVNMFTTTSACDAPQTLATSALDDASATITWVDGPGIIAGHEVTITGGPTTPTTPTTVAAGVQMLALTGLTGSTTYTVVIANDCGANPSETFMFTTLASPPANDDICNAEALVVNPAATTAGDNTAATAETGEPVDNTDCWFGTTTEATMHSVWYTFVAPANSIVTVNTDFATGMTDNHMSVYAAPTDCTDMTTLPIAAAGCGEDDGATGSGFMAVIELEGLTGGATYYVQVDGYGSAQGDFEIEVTSVLENDDCVDATDITDTAVYSFDTADATDSGIATGCSTAAPKDIWYTLTTDDAGDEFTVTVTNGASWEVFSDCGTTSMGCNLSPVPATTATQYWIRVFDTADGLDGGGHGNNAGVNARAIGGTIQVGGILLPIQLSSFTGTERGTANELSWTTSQEENSAYFMVEKSQNGVDKFVEVGMETAAGNSYATTNYSMTDATPFNKSYYRLKMVDIDGSFEYSELIVIERKNGGLNVTNLYPNPSDSKVNMIYETQTSEVTIQVTNLLGQTIINQTVATSIGVNNYPIDLTSAQSGIYYVTLTDGSNSITKKVVKN